MSEAALTWLVLARMLALTWFVFFYVVGGRHEKAWRRYVGAIGYVVWLLIISLFSGSFSWWILIPLSVFVVGISRGYSAKHFLDKVEQRFKFGIVLGGSAFVLGLMNGHVIIAFLQLGLSVTASVIMGSINPEKAVNEEAIIALCSTVLMIFMV